MPKSKLYQIRQFNDQVVVGNLFLDEHTKLYPQQAIRLTLEEAKPFVESEKPVLQEFFGDEDMVDIIEFGNWAPDPGLVDFGYEATKRKQVEETQAKDAEIADLKAQLAAKSA